MDGISDWPGEPWETSIPNIIVGVVFINGILLEISTDNKEFVPPSCKREEKLKFWERERERICVDRFGQINNTFQKKKKGKKTCHCSIFHQLLTLELIFNRTLVKYWSLIFVGAMHCVTIPSSWRFFFFHGPWRWKDACSRVKLAPWDTNVLHDKLFTYHKYLNSFFQARHTEENLEDREAVVWVDQTSSPPLLWEGASSIGDPPQLMYVGVQYAALQHTR